MMEPHWNACPHDRQWIVDWLIVAPADVAAPKGTANAKATSPTSTAETRDTRGMYRQGRER
jgi:hypothetical protein